MEAGPNRGRYGRCHICGDRDHYQNRCPQRQPQQGNWGGRGNTPRGGPSYGGRGRSGGGRRGGRRGRGGPWRGRPNPYVYNRAETERGTGQQADLRRRINALGEAAAKAVSDYEEAYGPMETDGSENC